MSYDNLETIYHLTPAGWVQADERYFGKDQGVHEPIPENRVETWKRHETQASEWSRTYVDWTCVWVTESISRTQRDALRNKHPIPENPNRRGMKIGEAGLMMSIS